MTPLQRTSFSILICLVMFVHSGLEAIAETTPILDPDQQMAFAESLFGEADYFRAITEYKRFIFFFPGEARVETSYFRIAESYYRAKRWAEADESFQTFSMKFPHSALAAEAVYFRALSKKNLKKFDDALVMLDALARATTGEIHDRAVYQQGLIYIERADWKRATGSFTQIPSGSVFYPSAHVLIQGLDNADQLPKKSPLVAGTLAAVLPGAGHLYTDRPRDDGCLSFECIFHCRSG